MAVTLYSPNPGASGVATIVHAVLTKRGNARVPEFEIKMPDKKELENESFRLSPGKNVFIVERFNMPDPLHDGSSVIVYRTTLCALGKTYVATCYTNTRGTAEPRIVDLSTKQLQVIGQQVGKIDPVGIWQSLLRADRLERISVF